MAEVADACGCKPYTGCVPIADLTILAAVAGQERRGQGSDYVHEFLRLAAVQDRGIMNQQQALGYRLTSESGANRTRAETNNPPNTAAPGGA